MLLEVAVVVEVEGVLIVLVEVLPCAVVVDSEVAVVVVVPGVFKKTRLTTYMKYRFTSCNNSAKKIIKYS